MSARKSMSVDVCVCLVRLCVCVLVCLCVFVSVCVRMYVFLLVCMFVCLLVSVCLCLSVCLSVCGCNVWDRKIERERVVCLFRKMNRKICLKLSNIQVLWVTTRCNIKVVRKRNHLSKKLLFQKSCQNTFFSKRREWNR